MLNIERFWGEERWASRVYRKKYMTVSLNCRVAMLPHKSGAQRLSNEPSTKQKKHQHFMVPLRDERGSLRNHRSIATAAAAASTDRNRVDRENRCTRARRCRWGMASRKTIQIWNNYFFKRFSLPFFCIHSRHSLYYSIHASTHFYMRWSRLIRCMIRTLDRQLITFPVSSPPLSSQCDVDSRRLLTWTHILNAICEQHRSRWPIRPNGWD